MTPLDLSIRLFLQVAVVLGACLLVGRAAARFGQPQVVAEMVAGVLLGPSVLGVIAARAFASGWTPIDLQAWLFPAASRPLLFALGQMGVALYMFLVGVEFRTDLFRERAGGAGAVSVAGMVVPFLLGAGVATQLIGDGEFFAASVRPWQAMLFLGAAMCITAFPMLARIIVERGLSGTALGTLALSAGAMDDAAAWCILAIVLASFHGQPSIAALAIGGGAVYAAGVLTVGRRLLRRLADAVDHGGELDEATLTIVLMVVMLGAWFTDAIGIYAVFGAFVLGAAMPRGRFGAELRRAFEPAVVTLLLPLFFAYSGLNTRLDLLDSPRLWGVALLVLAAACLGKGVACWGAARLLGEDQPTALAVGALMNARGLMELIILNIGLEAGIITPGLFSIMVLMAIVTTLMAAPLFERVYGRAARAAGTLPARA